MSDSPERSQASVTRPCPLEPVTTGERGGGGMSKFRMNASCAAASTNFKCWSERGRSRAVDLVVVRAVVDVAERPALPCLVRQRIAAHDVVREAAEVGIRPLRHVHAVQVLGAAVRELVLDEDRIAERSQAIERE